MKNTEVTAFLLSCGEKSVESAREALYEQNMPITIKEIQNVAPMSAAFNEMLSRCETPYFVQVDADMILDRNAIKRLYDWIQASDPAVYMEFGQLLDVFLDMPIVGVKIYRHEIAAKFPYRNVAGCEMDQLNRAKAEGYKVIGHWDCPALGLHVLPTAPQAIYDRYRTLWLRMRRGDSGMSWVADLPRAFLNKYLQFGEDSHLWAFLGCVAGDLDPDPTATLAAEGEKDYRRTPKWFPEFWELVKREKEE